MRQRINGRVHDVVTNPDGSISVNEIRRVGRIPSNRALVLTHEDGSNKLLNPNEKIHVAPEQYFVELPNGVRGGRVMASYSPILEHQLQMLSAFYELTLSKDMDWVIAHEFQLPPGFNRRTTDVLLEIPRDYPISPLGVGVGARVYVDPDLRFHGRKLQDVHESTTPGWGKWAWLCYKSLAWDPRGDNFISFLERIRTDLTDPPT